MAKGKHRKPGRIGPFLKRPAIAVPLFVVVGVGLTMAVMALAAPRYSEWRTEREAAKEAARLERCAERARNETPLSAFAEGFAEGLVEGLTGAEVEDDNCPPVTTTTTTLPPPTAPPPSTAAPAPAPTLSYAERVSEEIAKTEASRRRTGEMGAPWHPGQGWDVSLGDWSVMAVTSAADVTSLISEANLFVSPAEGKVFVAVAVSALRDSAVSGTDFPALSFRISLISSGRAYEMSPLCGSVFGDAGYDPYRRAPAGGDVFGLACFEIPRSALGDLLLLAEGHGGGTYYWNVSQGVKSLLGPAPPLFP